MIMEKDLFIKKTDLYFSEEIEAIKRIDKNILYKIACEIEEARRNGRHIFICGNGGSAATASHYCCDFNKGVSGNLEENTNFICLSDNIPTITAIANDISYDDIFSYQLNNRLRQGDLLFVISGSGNSANIVKAMEVAKQKGNKIIGLCGYDGGKVKQMADICLHVNVQNMQIVEDLHMIFDHCLMYILSN